MTKEIKAPAKINLFLDITGKTDNGYHRLFMIMQTVDLYDYINDEELKKLFNINDISIRKYILKNKKEKD